MDRGPGIKIRKRRPMKQMMIRALGVVGATLTASVGLAQFGNWGSVCVDPMNMMPRTNDHNVGRIGNDLMVIGLGLSGSVTYGGENGPCFNPAVTIPIAGNFAINIGPQGSIHQTSQDFQDDGMAVTFGAFQDPAWCYAAISKGGERTRWGAGGFSEFFVGFSNRYMRATQTVANVRAQLQIEVVADAIRFRWNLTNLDTADANIGLWFGGAVAMLVGGGQSFTGDISTGFGGFPGKGTYVFLPNQRPPNTDISFDKNLNPATFPAYADLCFGQTDAFGIRVENESSAATSDVAENQPAIADRFWIGKNTFLLGAVDATDAAFPVAMLPDTTYQRNSAFVQAFPEQVVPAGQSIQILHYVRSTWGTSDYKLPYGVVVDAPKLIGTPQNDFNGNPLGGNIFPNPFNMRVYVDNVGGYGFDGREFPLNDVRVKVKFAANSGITLTGATATVPYELERTIAVVPERETRFLDFQATAGPNVSGIVPYTVEIFSQPGNVRKTIQGSITFAARPRLSLVKDANFVTFPFTFTDTSLETILENFLDPNVAGGDFQAYRWDPIQQGYVIANSVERGRSYWVIYNNDAGTNTIANLAGSPTMPPANLNSSQLIQNRFGFNMIGNPYNYPIPVNQINGVSAAAPQTSRTFREMVELGYVQSFLTTWDPVAKDYVFIDSESGVLEPNRGYWVRVLTPDDVTFNFPPVFETFVPEQQRRPNAWRQTERQWKLQLSARTADGIDAQNFVGQAASADQARKLRIYEPPMAPVQKVAIAIEEQINGQPTRMAQSLSETQGRHEWKIIVTAKEAGDVTVTWPNLGTLPKNVRLRLEDKATGASRFLRQTSGYTFRMDKPGTRELRLTSEVGGIATAVIGNVVASQPARSTNRNSPFTISYTLSGDATTSVRILAANGKEVFTVTRGRADRAGQNSVVWNLRNAANQAVAPGTYRVEIVVETATGERVRKVVPINVIR